MLANESRLRFLRAVYKARGTKGVSLLAEEIGVAVPTASIYLRALNARGLIDVKRQSSCVFYGGGKDRSLPEAQKLQVAFARLFAKRDLPDDWPARVVSIIRPFANPRRVEIVKVVAAEGPLSFGSLSRLAGISETSLLRHLSLLLGAGVLATDSKRRYVVARPRNSLAKALLSIATS